MSTESVYFYDNLPEPEDAAAQLLEGLGRSGKCIAPKFLYDEKGSELFTEITRQPEYYPTRTEMSLFAQHVDEIAEVVGRDCLLIEYGSGSSEKIRILLENLRPKIYAPLDISREYLASSASALAREYPWLEVRAACVDYSREFELPFDVDAKRVGFFPGSSIGNFNRDTALDFLVRVRKLVGAEGGLLIGVDLKKDPEILNAAYNDAAGVTAAFNLNVLEHLNREFDADFDTGNFAHLAEYNEEQGCMQMFLVSLVDQAFSIAGETFSVQAGERIHTENSHKYSIDEFLNMASRAGFRRHHCWTDENSWFGLFYLHC